MITVFLLLGMIFIPVGFVTLRASRSVVEIVERYDADCVPTTFKENKISYITDSSIPKNCSKKLQVYKYMKAPIYVHYQLDNYYQNNRRYVKSRSNKQLLHGLQNSDTSTCIPQEHANDQLIVPYGLVAWSIFNDTYTFSRGALELIVNRKNIAWKSDRDHKFGKDVYPYNFQNGTVISGGKLDPQIHVSILNSFMNRNYCGLFFAFLSPLVALSELGFCLSFAAK
ncbi:Putative ALA-interacting subunit 2 [Linum perenne]